MGRVVGGPLALLGRRLLAASSCWIASLIILLRCSADTLDTADGVVATVPEREARLTIEEDGPRVKIGGDTTLGEDEGSEDSPLELV